MLFLYFFWASSSLYELFTRLHYDELHAKLYCDGLLREKLFDLLSFYFANKQKSYTLCSMVTCFILQLNVGEQEDAKKQISH